MKRVIFSTSVARTVIVFAALLAFSCETFQPVSLTMPATKSRTETIDCAIGYVNSLGYTVVDANRDAGFLRAEKKTSGAGTMVSVALLGAGANKYDAMTVAVYGDPKSSLTQLKITSSTMNEPMSLFGAGRRTDGQPSPALVADTKTILSACGGESPAVQAASSKIVISSFVRTATPDARLVGSFDLANENDVAVMSIEVECSVASVATRNLTRLPALGPHQKTHVTGVSFSAAEVPDGVPTCRAINVSLP
jgi:hypothetical protein